MSKLAGELTWGRIRSNSKDWGAVSYHGEEVLYWRAYGFQISWEKGE
jgi:hypothetical protein